MYIVYTSIFIWEGPERKEYDGSSIIVVLNFFFAFLNKIGHLETKKKIQMVEKDTLKKSPPPLIWKFHQNNFFLDLPYLGPDYKNER